LEAAITTAGTASSLSNLWFALSKRVRRELTLRVRNADAQGAEGLTVRVRDAQEEGAEGT
jgi:hypothetical protein